MLTSTLPPNSPPLVNDQGEPVKTLLRNANDARSLWMNLREADLGSVDMMARVQAMVDGVPPLSAARLRETGQGWRSNFNDGTAKTLLDTAKAAYTDLINADPTFIKLSIRWPNAAEKSEFESIMSEEISQEIRSWSLFLHRYLYIAHYMVLHGVAVTYFEDCYNWQWDVTALQYFKVPRDTQAAEDRVAYAFMKKYMQVPDLMVYVDNEELAAKEGWNIPAIKSAIMTATPPYPDSFNWMEWREQWKNNNIVFGQTAPSVAIIYGWVRENDGTISLYVFAEGGTQMQYPNNDQFLCKKEHYFDSAEQAYTFFTNGIGTNGTIHSIQGLGKDMFNALQELMRLRNRRIDIAAQGPVFKPQSMEAAESLQITPAGPFMLIDPRLEAVPITFPSMAANIQPALVDLERVVQNNVGQYTNDQGGAAIERTRTEVLANLEQSARLSVTSVSLFYAKLDKLFREVVRRWMRKGYLRTDPGGHEVHNWRLRCRERGVPAAALEAVDVARTKANRVIGYGSPAMRRAALEQLQGVAPQFDARGKYEFLRMYTAAVTNSWEITNELVPPQAAAPRPPIDASIASQQNGELIDKGVKLMNPETRLLGELITVPVMPNENHQIHLQIHTNKIAEIVGMFEEAGQNPELFQQIVPPLGTLYEHSVETLEQYSGPDVPMYNQILQQAGEILVNGTRHLQKLQEQQQQEAERAALESGGTGAPDSTTMQKQVEFSQELERRAILFQQKLQQAQQMHAMKLQMQAQSAQQGRQISDAAAAADMVRKQSAQFLIQNPR